MRGILRFEVPGSGFNGTTVEGAGVRVGIGIGIGGSASRGAIDRNSGTKAKRIDTEADTDPDPDSVCLRRRLGNRKAGVEETRSQRAG